MAQEEVAATRLMPRVSAVAVRTCSGRRAAPVYARGASDRREFVALRDTPPFRADHVGSLLRPPGLLQAREDHAAGRLGDDELRAAEDQAIREVIQLQRDVGLRTATDGEFRRASWHMDFIYQLDGVTKAPGDLKVQFHNEQGDIEFTPAAMQIDGRLGVSETIFGDAFEFLKSCASPQQTPKLTIPSPSMVHYRGGRASIDESLYPDMDEFWSDLVGAYREEVRRLGELGCTYLQFDDTSLAYLNDPKQREHVRAIGGDASISTRSISATSTKRSPAVPRTCA